MNEGVSDYFANGDRGKDRVHLANAIDVLFLGGDLAAYEGDQLCEANCVSFARRAHRDVASLARCKDLLAAATLHQRS